MRECADEDGCREQETGYPELGCPRQDRSEVTRANLDLRGRPTVGVASREKLDEAVGNFSGLARWSEETG